MDQTRDKNQMLGRYPLLIHLPVNILALGLILVNGAEYLLAWTRIILNWATPVPNALVPHPLTLQDNFEILFVSHLGLLVALVLSRGIIFFSPQISIESDGLRMETLLGSRFFRFEDLKSVHSAEVQPNGRFVVWVNGSPGLPLQNLLGSLLFKRFFREGFLITSDLAGFDLVMSTIVEQLKRKYDHAFVSRVSEEQPTWLLSMLDVPGETITELTRAEIVPIDRKTAAHQMILAIGALVLPLVVGAIIHWQFPWSALLVAVIAIGEWPLASLFIVSIPMGDLQRISFEDALRVYPLTQLPRWIAGLTLTFLVVAGLPQMLFLPFVALALVLDCYWVMRLAEEWFAVHFPDAAIATLATGIYQLFLFGLLLVLLPR